MNRPEPSSPGRLGGLAVSSVIAQNPSVRREAQDVLSVDHIIVVVGDLEDGSRQF
jgi:hypothetical protein